MSSLAAVKSDGFLGDSVDAISACLFSCTTGAVFSELHDQIARLERHA